MAHPQGNLARRLDGSRRSRRKHSIRRFSAALRLLI
jgi:hypothetical protein